MKNQVQSKGEQKAYQRAELYVFTAFFLSGFAGLMHQVVWAKLLVSLIGATAHAQAAVLAVFMGGLAIGSVLFGRLVDRHYRPLRTYMVLEILIGIYCLLLPYIMEVAGAGYVALAKHSFEADTLKLLLRFTLSLVVVLAPAILMGGTLPILARHLIGKLEETQRRVGGLYALNSFGAVLGAGVAGFVTLPLFGIYLSLVTASILNLAAAALVFKHARREKSVKPETSSGKAVTAISPVETVSLPYNTNQYLLTLVALALSGFAAMGYEVLFTRIISLSFGSSTYSFTVMLMSFITGISVGSAIVSRIRIKNPLWLLGVSQFTVVVALLAVTPLISRFPYLIGLLRIDLKQAVLGFELYQLGKAALCLGALLIPTTCLGFCFPLVAQIQSRHPQQIGLRVGSTYAWNTVGNVLGAVLTSLVLLPWLGLLHAFHFNFSLNLIAGLVILLVAGEVSARRRLLISAIPVSAIVIYLFCGTDWLFPLNHARNHLRLKTRSLPADDVEGPVKHSGWTFEGWKKEYVASTPGKKVVLEEDEHATVLVYGDNRILELFINTKPDASTHADLDTQILLGTVPLFLNPGARRILIIGHGSGITAGSALRHPVERADIVEISRGVLNVDSVFGHHNYMVLNDRRTHAYLDDGSSFLSIVPDKYDVIISVPSNPWIAGIAGLFTVEFFERVKEKLNPGGVATVWFQQYEQTNDAVRMILRTLGHVFPNVMIWRSSDYFDVFTVASAKKIEPDFAKMEDRFDDPAVRNDLIRIGITNLTGLLSHHSISQDRLRKLVSSSPGPLNSVWHQRLEYSAPRSLFRDASSNLIQISDPLYSDKIVMSDCLLDKYMEYRKSIGDPVSQEELADAARIHPKKNFLLLRSEQAPKRTRPATRPARGLITNPENMGFYEATYWVGRFNREGNQEGAKPFLQRIKSLHTNSRFAGGAKIEDGLWADIDPEVIR